jgi:hypothetical protein
MSVITPFSAATAQYWFFLQVAGRMSWPWCPVPPPAHSGLSRERASQKLSRQGRL